MNIIYAKIDLMFLSKMMFLRSRRGSSITNYRVGGCSTEPHPYIYINHISYFSLTFIYKFTFTFSLTVFYNYNISFIIILYLFTFNFSFYFIFSITYNTIIINKH